MVLKVIHIGKCGGSTVISLLKKNNIEFENIHITKPVFNENDKYLIIIRNPIDRFVSAFNWRNKLVVKDKIQENRFLGEKNTLIKYNCINTLAENICDFDVNKTYIHHIYENIDFYLYDFLKNVKKENIICFVSQENLEYEMKEIFNISSDFIQLNKNNTVTDKYLSELGKKLLKEYLQKDYECVDKLFHMGCLTQKQYDILSK